MITQKIELKFCEDCKWSRLPKHSSPEFTRCVHPNVVRDGESLVSRQHFGGSFCSSARDHQGKCGLVAQLFEEREIVRVPVPSVSWWRRLFV